LCFLSFFLRLLETGMTGWYESSTTFLPDALLGTPRSRRPGTAASPAG
jgi:hypothetical protein